MINEIESKDDVRVAIKPRDAQVIVYEDPNRRIGISIPSGTELNTVEESGNKGITEIIYEKVTDVLDPIREFELEDSVIDELNRLLSLSDKYGRSISYAVKVADLYTIIKDGSASSGVLAEAAKNTNSTIIINRLADSLLYENKINDAEKVLSDNRAQNDAENENRLAMIALTRLKLDQAKEAIGYALTKEPENYGSRLLAGALNLYEENIEQSIRHFRSAINERPESSVAHTNIAIAYLKIKNTRQAEKHLKIAIGLDPLNENALMQYADLVRFIGHPNAAIEPLELYLQYKTNAVAIVEKLAQVQYTAKNYRNSLELLRHELTFQSTAAVYNNIGLMYWRLGQKKQAREAFFKALELCVEDKQFYGTVLFNTIAFLSSMELYDAIIDLARIALYENTADRLSEHTNAYPRVKHAYMNALANVERYAEARDVALEIIDNKKHVDDADIGALLYVLSYYTHIDINKDNAREYAGKIITKALDANDLIISTRIRAYNNVIFSYLYFDDIVSAKKYISKLSTSIHHDPFATATLGLYEIKLGKTSDGIGLYQEAISLASSRLWKDRIRQRMNIEIAKTYLRNGEPTKAGRYLKRAITEKKGYKFAKKEASALLNENR